MNQRILIPSSVAVRYTGELETTFRVKAHKGKLTKVKHNDIVVIEELLAISLCKKLEWNRVKEIDLDVGVLFHHDTPTCDEILSDDDIYNAMALDELLTKMNQTNYMDFSEEEQRAVAKHYKVNDNRKSIDKVIALLLAYLPMS
jgi:hypothetical protein